MAYIIAVLMASLSFLLNRAALKYFGLQAIITLSPVLEEAAKTLLAYYLGADIIVTHIIFGALEAGYDWHTSRRHGAAAAFFSVLGHGLFGLATVAVLVLTGSIAVGLAAGVIFHLAWNITVIRLVA